ncbi:MAG: phosphoserine phosphatase [Salibacteraceae bacterium]|jgi:phosphoserine phosphatase
MDLNSVLNLGIGVVSYSLITLISGCSSPNMGEEKVETSITAVDPLPSWNEGKTKTAIFSYVEEVTDPESVSFINVKDRIATFDNDGNLWAEQPMYFQLYFAIDRIKAMADNHPEWKTEQPYQAILENDMKSLLAQGEKGLIQIVMTSHTGNTQEEFKEDVKKWIATAKHPTLNVGYDQLVYQPMLELLTYLRGNNFKIFIVSGGGVDFMRAFVTEIYGIPEEQILGSRIKTEFDYNDGNPQIKRLPVLDFTNDKDGKPENIQKIIGKKPVFSSGNSDGDLAMMQYTASHTLKSFMLYVHHTDEVREWAYDRKSHIGKLDKGLDQAEANGWTVIDMKNDWNVVYPFQLKK